MLPNEETTRSDLAARPGELEALLAVAGRAEARPIVAFLREQRLNVTLVQDADSAFEEAVLHRPNLVIAHEHLPPAGGLELTQRLKANTRTHFLPTILFAASGSGIRAQAYGAGADAVFTPDDDPQERHARLWALLKTQALFRRHERKRESQGVALRERGQWLGSFMHDLQNAVGALQANFEFLSRFVGPTSVKAPGVRPADLSECTEETRSLLLQLAHGLRTVQDYERFENGRIGLKEAPIVPGELLGEVCAEIRSRGDGKSEVALELAAPSDLPACTGDRDLLRRALGSLVMLLARRPGATAVHLSASQGPDGPRFVLVGDGEPLPAGEETQLFDPFSPLALGARKGPIGERFELALARAIVEVHRGRLQPVGGEARGGQARAGFSVELRSRDSWPKSH